jgi:hypothetical protein
MKATVDQFERLAYCRTLQRRLVFNHFAGLAEADSEHCPTPSFFSMNSVRQKPVRADGRRRMKDECRRMKDGGSRPSTAATRD